LNEGSSLGSLNLPNIHLRLSDWKNRGCRILNIHGNVPGVLKVRRF
jgi:hypothetical protein